MPLLRSSPLDGVPGIRHGFGTRQGGASSGRFSSLNLSTATGDALDTVRENRRRFANAFGLPLGAMLLAEQRHTSRVALAEVARPLPAGGFGHPGVDALVTDRRGLLLTALAADCVPILLAADDGSAVAAVHAGWRGTVAGVVREAVAKLQRLFEVEPSRIVAAIGPGIGPCCYEVDRPVLDAFGHDHPALTAKRGGRAMLDLAAANRLQLIEAGVDAGRIDDLALCTGCRTDLFYSHRVEGEPTGRFGTSIVLV